MREDLEEIAPERREYKAGQGRVHWCDSSTPVTCLNVLARTSGVDPNMLLEWLLEVFTQQWPAVNEADRLKLLWQSFKKGI